MINLATQRVVFVAAKSNSLMLAIFSVACGVYYFCACDRVFVGRAEIGRQSLRIAAANSVGSIETRGCCSFGSLPGADVTPQVAFSKVGREHEC